MTRFECLRRFKELAEVEEVNKRLVQPSAAIGAMIVAERMELNEWLEAHKAKENDDRWIDVDGRRMPVDENGEVVDG